MKAGDLVKFQSLPDGPIGVVVRDEEDTARVYWCDKYTPTGSYKKYLLEVAR